MANCECLPGCGFYHDKMVIDKGIGKLYKTQYCEGDSSNCARYTVFKKFGKGTVPVNLYPNQMDRAKNIVAGTEPHA
jgi:hypothetical protein